LGEGLSAAARFGEAWPAYLTPLILPEGRIQVLPRDATSGRNKPWVPLSSGMSGSLDSLMIS
jgi:hypothetical protein